MNGSQPRMNGRCSRGFRRVRWVLFSWFILVILVDSPLVQAQNATPSAAAPAACPIEFVHFDPSGGKRSGKKCHWEEDCGADF